MAAPFLPGAEVSRQFHAEAVAPLLSREFPRLRYAAARLGSGSDVLGLDDERSRDHDWGCRLNILVDEPDAPVIPAVRDMLDRELPETFRGFPVRFGVTWDPAPTHNVDVATVGGFAASRLGAPTGAATGSAADRAADLAAGPAPDPSPDPAGWSSLDWLTVTGQGVLEVTAGPVFTDGTRALGPLRAALEWYPPQVERYVLAAGWRHLAEELPFLGRTADRGDELGSRVISARMADTLICLAFLLERRWIPYRKWRGTVFGLLPVASRLAEPVARAVSAPDWREREDAIASAAEVLLDVQRSRGLPVTGTATIPFFDRPYRTVPEELMTRLRGGITDPALRALPAEMGSLDQWADCHAILSSATRQASLRVAYRTLAAAANGPGPV